MSERPFIEIAESSFPDLIKGQKWRGNAAKYWFICEKHGKYLQIYRAHQQGSRCRKCQADGHRRRKLLTIEEAERRQPDLVKGQTWRGNHANYEYVCDTHGIYKQQFSNHHSGERCRECAKKTQGAYHKLTIKEAQVRHPDLVRGQEWKGTLAAYKYECPTHGIYKQVFNAHDKNKQCPLCRESKGEKRISRVLESTGLSFSRQKKFGSCKSKRVLPFDFYIEDLTLLIEYHGRQHYHPVREWGGKKTFEGVQHRDGIKRRWAKKHGIRLLIVPYTVRNIEAYVTKRLHND